MKNLEDMSDAELIDFMWRTAQDVANKVITPAECRARIRVMKQRIALYRRYYERYGRKALEPGFVPPHE